METEGRLDLAQHVVTVLRHYEAELREEGLKHLSVFGSVARGDFDDRSDIDLAVELDPAARMDYFRLAGLELKLGQLLGRSVELLPEPVRKTRLQANIDRDRIRAF